MLRQAIAITLLSSPAAAALECLPSTACTVEGTCETEVNEGPFRLSLQGDTLAFVTLPEAEQPPTAPEIVFTEVAHSNAALRVFTAIPSAAGDAALLTLTNESHFTLSVHGQLFGTPFGLLSEGPCTGAL
ncbi:hypothetical protein FHY55_10870 [Oceanicola sp. D3]|uniref:hypothetical protein n=1 Tax=Oceanicola sp. D3 TaxID=2587163 RepID=UPI00111EC717|nr:hypothetical protein [Oceanicola sp. D3]QDC09716.1 hypothetical protein FHY55_10870 [Oceanicola sp. D3]